MWQLKKWYEKECKEEWTLFHDRIKQRSVFFGSLLFLLILILVASFPLINEYNSWGITSLIVIVASFVLDIPIFLMVALASIIGGMVFFLSLFSPEAFVIKMLLDSLFIVLLAIFFTLLKHSLRKQ